MKRYSRTLFSCLMAAFFLHASFFAASAQARTITDMVGRSVDVPDKVERIVSAYAPATLFILCAGLGDRMVGADSHADKQSLFNAVMQGRSFGKVGNRTSGLNLEAIVALKPDLVILYSQKDGRTIADKLEKLGIASLIIKPESIDDMKHILTLLAEATGTRAKVDKVVAAMDDMLRTARERTKDIAPEQRASVYYSAPQGPMTTVSGEMLQTEMIELAGAFNPSRELEGFFQRISPEQFVKWNPDVLVYSRRLSPKRLDIFEGEQFATVTAVRDNRLYRFPSRMAPWDFPSPMSVPGVLWIAKKTYPERFADVDMGKRTAAFYDTIFGPGFCAKTQCADDVN